MQLVFASLLVTSLFWLAIGERSNEETFGYGVKLRSKGRLKEAMTEIRTNRESEFISMTIAKGDTTYETLTIIDVMNHTVAYQNMTMEGCAVQLLPEDIDFEDVMQTVKTPPRYRLGIEGLVCYVDFRYDAEELVHHPEIAKLCGTEVASFEIKSCTPAIRNNRPEDVCLISGYVYNTKDKTGGLYCIRELRQQDTKEK